MNYKQIEKEIEILFNDYRKADKDKLKLLIDFLHSKIADKSNNTENFLKCCFSRYSNKKAYNDIMDSCKELMETHKGDRDGELYQIIYNAMGR